MLAESKPYEWVVYDPPKSVSFGHQARVKDARRAWKLTEEFLNQQADFALGHHLDLTYYEPTQEADAPVASARLAAARAVLGPETSAQPNCLRWKIQPDQLSAAIDFALDDEKFPLWAWHPTNLHLYYLFTWKHFDLLLAPNETRDVRSTLGVTIGGGSVFFAAQVCVSCGMEFRDLPDAPGAYRARIPISLPRSVFQAVVQSGSERRLRAEPETCEGLAINLGKLGRW